MQAQTSEQAIPRLRDKLRTYFHNSTTYLGLTLVACNATALTFYFGATLAAVWMVLAAAGLLGVVYLTVKSFGGDHTAHRRSIVVNCLTIATWMAGAIGLWSTGEPAAWVLAILCCSSWSMHVIFMGQRSKLLTSLGMLAIATVPLLAFMLLSAWSYFPAWVAVPTSIASLAMIASIAASAQISNQNFKTLQLAIADAAANKKRLEFAIESAGDGYLEFDIAANRLTPLSSLFTMTGYERRELTIEDGFGMIHPDEREEAIASFERLKSGASEGWDQELRMRMADGSVRWMRMRARALKTADGSFNEVIATLVDLTSSKALEAELRAAKEAAEASSSAKSQFLANMSHEIRTPLNGVLGMAQALDGDELAPAQKEKVAIILDSGKSLTALLNDVLDLTKIEAGKLEISAVPGDFLHTMKRTRQLFQAQAEDKGLELLVRYDSNFPQRLAYDPVRVRQCIGNLLSNAIKFTAKGRVEVAISAKGSGAGQHMVSVEISDTGIGMSPETVGKLFSVFTQADSATTRKFGGSGLGLAISRQLARMMGGDLVVESREGKGSIFRLTFKAQEAAPAAATETVLARRSGDASKRSLRGVRVLLTDDNAINRQVIKLFLAPQGCDIVEAANGKEALDKAASGDFDVMLLDIHMPVMDGKEAIQRLRAANQPWSKMPVIALTADAMSGDREKYLALGMTDYVSKPVDQRELVAKMYSVLKLEAPDAAPEVKTGT